jgi:hypothetical protein
LEEGEIFVKDEQIMAEKRAQHGKRGAYSIEEDIETKIYVDRVKRQKRVKKF